MKRSTSETFDIYIGETRDKLSVMLINERRRTAAIKAYAPDKIELRAPLGFDARKAREWLCDPRLASRLSRLMGSVNAEQALMRKRCIGGYFYFLGEKLPIKASPSDEFYMNDDVLFVPRSAEAAEITEHIFKLYADTAKALMPTLVKRYADMKGVTAEHITIRHNRSRWGSCSALGTLSFTDALMAYPMSVIEYVALHEICHRLHMDHSREFWAEVAAVMPNYKALRDELRISLAPRE